MRALILPLLLLVSSVRSGLLDSIPMDPAHYKTSFALLPVKGHLNLFFSQAGNLVRYPLSGPGAKTAQPLAKLAGDLRSICARDGKVAFSAEGRQLGLIDPSLSVPLVFDSIFPDIRCEGVDLESGRIYVAQGDDGVGVLDPGATGAGRYRRFPLPGREVNTIRARKGRVFLGTAPIFATKLLIFEVAGDSLRPQGEFSGGDYLSDMLFHGDSLILLARDDLSHASQVTVISIREGSEPGLVNKGSFSGRLNRLGWSDTSLLASASDGIYRLDKNMVLAPQDTGLVRERLFGTGFNLSGDFALVSDTLFGTGYSAADNTAYLYLERVSGPLGIVPVHRVPRRAAGTGSAVWRVDGRKAAQAYRQVRFRLPAR